MSAAFLRRMFRSLSIVLMLWTGIAMGQGAPVLLYSGNVGLSVWDTDTTRVAVSMQVVNGGTAAAQDVRVTSVALSAGS